MLVTRPEYNYYPEYIEEENPKKITKKKKRVRIINKRMYISMAMILFFTGLFVLNRYAKITEARLEITRMEKEVSELNKLKLNLIGELESLKSTTVISETAINNLGMMYPEENQIVYISVEEKLEVAEGNKSFGGRIKDTLNSFIKFF